MHRYLAVAWNRFNLESVRTFQSFGLTPASKPADWTIAYEDPAALVMHTGLRRGSAEAYPLKNNSGVVLGRIFDRQHSDYAAAPLISFDADATRKIVSSAGQHLVERYWGAYFAIVHDESTCRHHVFRDPIGNVPCYHVSIKGVDIFFSHIEDCVRLLPISFSINRQYLTRWLIYSTLTTRDSGLENVESVPAGERLTLSQGHVTRSVLWNPLEIARTALLERPEIAASTLRSTIQNTINAWASCYGSITHMLSGGFDSSVVAGCLAQAPSNPKVSYLNLSIDIELNREHLHMPGMDRRTADKLRAIAGYGDERHFARLVAERWKTLLIERQRSLSMDLMRLWNSPLKASPGMYFTAMETDDAQLELVKTHETQAFFSGQGGDSVFLATQQPFPAIDYVHQRGLDLGLWEQVVAASRLSKDSLWAVLGKAIRHGLLRRPFISPITVLNQPTLVNEALVGNLANEDFESDLAKRISCSGLPPGKRDHVNGVAWSAYYDFVFDAGQYADHVDPLNSQPVWEAMLQMPTWIVLAGGISRGLARQAFADLLPAEVRKRQVKGTGGPFYQHLVRRNRTFLRDTLLDGLLVKNGYLDRHSLEKCLAADEPSATVSAVSMLNYLAAEIWLQQWTENRQPISTAERAAQQNATWQ